MIGWNHPSRPQKFGAKHRDIVVQQIGRPSPFVDRDIALGRWYLFAKPEHIENPMLTGDIPGNALDLMAYSECVWGSVEPPYYSCPFCGDSNQFSEKHLAMSPLPCYTCGRIGWVYSPEMDAQQNWGDYKALCIELSPPTSEIAWEQYGIPVDVFIEVMQ